MNISRDNIMQEMGDSFSHFKRAMHLYVLQNISDHSLSPGQLGLLRAIYDRQPISHKALAKIMFMTPGAVSQLVDSLEEHRCVVKTINQADRRMTYLSISRHGKQLMDSYTKLRNKLLTSAFADVSVEDLQTFIRVQQSAVTWLDQQNNHQKENQ